MKKVIIANLKTYLSADEAIMLCEQISEKNNIIIAPAMIHTALLATKFPNLKIATQDISSFAKDFGAYTGETPVSLLTDLNIKYAIIGHSERRSYNLDNKDTIAKKIAFCLNAKITPIICIGESKKDREDNIYLEVIKSQIDSLALDDFSNVILAYEPTWSVGTGILPSFDQISEVMAMLKSSIKFVDNKTILVYGGSVSAENAESVLSVPEVGGLLIGKASTDINNLRSILNII